MYVYLPSHFTRICEYEGNILSVSRVNGQVRISVVGSEPAENYEIHYVSRSTVTGRQLS